MIERYSREVMQNVWSEQSKFEAWLKVELAVCEVYHQQGKITDDEMAKLRKATFNIERIEEIEKTTRHDVVAFTRCVSESLGEEKRWIHYGLTSTDVVDTSYALLYKEANEILKDDLQQLKAVLIEKAQQTKHYPCIGRTHGVHAEITSFGLKFALWVEEINRQIERFDMACEDVQTGKISGAVGNHVYTGIPLQDETCKLLGINSAKISTQTLQRDRHAFYLSTLALIAGTLEKISVEMRHLQRTEVREVEEGFAKGQKGSSAMPHKRNPISFENITGASRVIRGYMLAAYENIPLWHERDISHSSVERIIMPDATILLDYALNRMIGLMKNIGLFEDRMLANIGLTHGVIFAQRIMNVLIDEKGWVREEAYDMIQPIAMDAWTNKKDFKTLLEASDRVMSVFTQDELDSSFDVEFYLREVDSIFKRVGI